MPHVSRAPLLLAVLGALAVGALLSFSRPDAQAIIPGVTPTITVNSTADTNTRDSVMTLREAILLATGGLSLNAITEGECGQVFQVVWDPVHGFCLDVDAPGATSADRIIFDSGVFPAGSPATIVLIPGFLGAGLPSLDTGNDTIDGSSAGVIVDGAGVSDCFYMGSDGNAIKGLQIFNCNTGVEVNGGQNNTIGGSSAAERNVISGNDRGVLIAGSGNTIKGNYIGTNAAGTAAMPNDEGVYLSSGSQNTVGGSTPAERNVISGNAAGLHIQADGNSIEGNYIGTNAAGTAALPNGTGVRFLSAQDNTVGGTAAGEGNLIAFNTGAGVYVDGHHPPSHPEFAAMENTIRGNSIHSNGGMGIDNASGGNTELAPPVITGFGSVTGAACPNCTIDVYSDDEDEGRLYEGSTSADGAGNWTFDGSPEGPNVTATATDAAGNTSEFSAPVPVPEATFTPTPTPTPTPPPGATPTPPVGTTRTLQWGPGWHNEVWSGAGGTAPQDAFACAAGSYAAAYRFTDAGLQRFFPDRRDISNMAPLTQYDAFLILITQPVTCTMPLAAAPGADRTLQWGPGWHNDGWTGADAMQPDEDFACADGGYGAAYRFTDAGLQRYFPGRSDISNMTPLNKYDAFLILVTTAVDCAMTIAP